MEVFLGLAGLLGLSALLQSKALPTEKDYTNALATLNNKKDDPDASLVAGKYKAFVEGDFPAGLEYLAKGSDKTLQALAVKELNPENSDSPVKKVGIGDDWVLAAKKYPALARIFYDHASQWYIEAYPYLQDLWKQKAKEQAAKLAAARPPAPAKKMPATWVAEGTGPSVTTMDGSIAHTGSYSAKFPERDPKQPGQEIFLKSSTIQTAGKTLDLSAFVRSDATENKTDQVFVNFFDRDGSLIGVSGPNVPNDIPFWQKVGQRVDIPMGTASLRIGAVKRSKVGTFWVDDISAKVDGQEVLKNGSFEER